MIYRVDGNLSYLVLAFYHTRLLYYTYRKKKEGEKKSQREQTLSWIKNKPSQIVSFFYLHRIFLIINTHIQHKYIYILFISRSHTIQCMYASMCVCIQRKVKKIKKILQLYNIITRKWRSRSWRVSESGGVVGGKRGGRTHSSANKIGVERNKFIHNKYIQLNLKKMNVNLLRFFSG